MGASAPIFSSPHKAWLPMNLPLDIETFPNFSLICIGSSEWHTSTVYSVEQRSEILRTIKAFTTYGYNSINYDMPMLSAILAARKVSELYKISKTIVEEGDPQWITHQENGLRTLMDRPSIDHYDIKEPAPAVMVSLKMYGARMNTKKLQSLPYDPHTCLTEEQKNEVIKYCFNDLTLTTELHTAIQDRLDLRERLGERYDLDLRSKSDAQIAEAIIRAGVGGKVSRQSAPDYVEYEKPHYIMGRKKPLRDVINFIERTQFKLKKGKVQLPNDMPQVVIGGMTYKFGIGGIHSTEKKQAIIPTEYETLEDRDVTGYYPNIIINLGLSPEGVGEKFLPIYRVAVEKRAWNKKRLREIDPASNEAKQLQVESEGFKILSNGSYGKFGSTYSFLYSPRLMLQTTLTGQLALLMLIERIEGAGIKVVSANTDGFVSLIPNELYGRYDAICAAWETATSFNLEATHYRSLHSRDVNSYIAITTGGDVKGKGEFAAPSLSKSPRCPILSVAVKAFLLNGAPLDTTIRQCRDITQFIAVRTVKGGAENNLGKLIRWYYSPNGAAIHYASNGNKVATTDGAMPLMDLPETFPVDIDYEKYIADATKLLEGVGYGC